MTNKKDAGISWPAVIMMNVGAILSCYSLINHNPDPAWIGDAAAVVVGIISIGSYWLYLKTRP